MDKRAEKRTREDRNQSVSQNSKTKKCANKTTSTRSRVLSDNSGYATAEFRFSSQDNGQPLIITEPNEDTSSWQ